MKNLYLILCFLAISFSSLHAQLYINAGLGTMNYAGDLQDQSVTFSEAKYNFTVGATYQFSRHILGNFNLTYGKIGAQDSKNAAKWINRNLDFQTGIFEAAVTGEYDLFDIRNGANKTYFNTEDQTQRFTPYVFAGLGVFNFNPYTNYNGQKVFLAPLKTEGETTPYKLWQVSIPFGLGVKYALSENVIIGAELNMRKTLTDYIDDVSQFKFVDTTVLLNTNGQLSASLSYRADELPNAHYAFYAQRGNPNKKDNYYTFMLKVIFKFGEGTSLFKYGYGN